MYSPPPKERDDVTAETLRKRQWQREHEPDALRDWRERMASEAGQAVYRRRKLTEHAHAKMKNRGFARMPVHGIAKVRVVCLLHALAHNMMQAHAHAGRHRLRGNRPRRRGTLGRTRGWRRLPRPPGAPVGDFVPIAETIRQANLLSQA